MGSGRGLVTGAGGERQYAIRDQQPAFRVTLTAHADGTALSEVYGLNDDIVSLQTNKTIRDPAGTWSLTTTIDRKPVRGRGATWADIITPMDHVEIALRATPRDPWTVTMRGFVDNVRYVDAVSPSDGIPRRRVVINGRDFGKIWLEFKIFYLLELQQVPLEDATSQRYWGITPKNWPPSEFLNELNTKLVAPKIAKLQEHNKNVVIPTVRCTVPNKYRVNGWESSFQTFQGPLYNLMQMYAAPPYTEFLIRDLPGLGQAETVWRWAPLLSRGNRLALPSHGDLPPVKILHASEIYNYNVGTSDNDRYTYFWARPSQYTGTDSSVMSKVQYPGHIDGAGIDLYGYKPLEQVFPMYAVVPDANPAGAVAPPQTRDFWGPQLVELTEWLADSFIWAVEQFEGDIQGPIRPDFVVGEYVDVPEENRRLYVEGVSHSFTVGQHPTTVLTVTRGLTLDDPTVGTPASWDPKTAAPGSIPGGSQAIGPPPPPVPLPGAESVAGPPPPARPLTQITQVAADIIAQQTPYVLGSRSYQEPTNAGDYARALAAIKARGIDCSEFSAMCYAFGGGGTLTPNAQAQYNASYRVGREQLVEGDLVYFEQTVSLAENNYDRISHVGVYVGNGQMANASSPSIGCVYADIDNSYWGPKFVSGGRFSARNPGGPSGGITEYNP